jgi:hypothetical protein
VARRKPKRPTRKSPKPPNLTDWIHRSSRCRNCGSELREQAATLVPVNDDGFPVATCLECLRGILTAWLDTDATERATLAHLWDLESPG